MLKRVLLRVSLPLIVCVVVTAQSKVRLVRSPVPFLSPDVEAANKPGVYFDSKLNQVVIKVAPNLASEIPQEFRYDIPNGASPNVLFSSSGIATGTIVYSYSLIDDSATAPATRRLSLLLPGADASLTAGKSKWSSSIAASAIADRTSGIPLATMRFVSLTHPGTPARGVANLLELESSYLPGFVDAFVEADVRNPLTSSALTGLPADLAEQVSLFLQPGVGTASIAVLGPLFPPGTPKSVVGGNFHYGVERLMRKGVLASDSAYGKATLAALDAFLQNGAAGRPAAIQAKPVTLLEQQLDAAMALAFR